MSQKTKSYNPNRAPKEGVNPVFAGMVGLVALFAAGKAGELIYHNTQAGHPNAFVIPATPSREVVNRLKSLQKEYPDNVVRVAKDKNHPGLFKVSYRFTPGHDTISDVYSTINIDQDITDAMPNVESYNGGTEITKNGQILTVDVDGANGYIVPNPNISDSVGNTG